MAHHSSIVERWLESQRLNILLHRSLQHQRTLKAMRAKLLALSSLGLGLTAPFITLGYFRAQEFTYGAIFIACLGFQLLAFLALKLKANTQLASHLSCLVLMLATLTGIHALGGLQSPATRWLVLVPVLGAIFGGALSGFIWLIVSAGVILALANAPALGITFPPPLPLLNDTTHQAMTLLTFMAATLSLFMVSEFLRAWSIRVANESDLRTDAIINAAPEGIIILDDDGELMRANAAAERLMQRQLPEEKLKSLLDRRQELALGPIELTSSASGATTLSLEVSMATLELGELSAKQHIFMLHDITRRHQAEQQLQRALDEAIAASQAKSRFLATMSHELRTPLNAVIGYAEIIIEELQEQGEQPLIHEAESIRTAGQSLLALIADILELARHESGKVSLQLESILLSRLFAELEQGTLAPIAANDNQLILELPEGISSLKLFTDPSKLRQLLSHLLLNAAKFTTQGVITLSASQDPKTPNLITLSVRDTGIGMSPDVLAHVWDDFVQADNSTTRKYGGAGLGLALVKRLAQLLSAHVTLESAVDQGTTFTLTLPIDRRKQLQDAPGAQEASA